MFDILIVVGWLIITFLSLSLIVEQDKVILRTIAYLLLSFCGFLLIPYTIFVDQSIVQSILAIIGTFGFIYLADLIFNRSYEAEYTSRMLLGSLSILIVTYSIQPIQSVLINTVASDTVGLLSTAGFDVSLSNASHGTYIVFPDQDQTLKTRIVLACTGVGTISIFGGLIWTIDKISFKKKLVAAFCITSSVYFLNVIRNAFIAVSYGEQWFNLVPNYIELIFGRSDEWVSYYIADRILAQFLSVIAVALIAYIFLTETDAKLFNEWKCFATQLVDDIRDIIK